MSLSLDLGLFFRNSKTKLGLSLTHRGLLFALAFRIGNNASTWIKQSTLAAEAGIDERNIRENMIKIRATDIVLVDYQSSDKRKLQYRFNKILTNYHLMNEEERKKIHLLLNDEYEHLNVLKHKSSAKNHRMKSSDTFQDTGRNHPVITGRNHPVILDEKTLEPPENNGFAAGENSPKDKVESNIKNKDKEKLVVDNLKSQPKSENPDLPDWLNKELWQSFVDHRKEMKSPLTNNAKYLAIKKLVEYRERGHDINQIIETSILSGWSGLFEPKILPSKPTKPNPPSQPYQYIKPCDNDEDHPDYAKKEEERKYWAKIREAKLARNMKDASNGGKDKNSCPVGNISSYIPSF